MTKYGMISYRHAIHPDFGKYTIENDIIVTPLWTREFCGRLVSVCEEFPDKFQVREPVYGTFELSIHDLSRLFLIDYAKHFETGILPMVRKEWFVNAVDGIFSPYLLRYTTSTKKDLQLHTDMSIFTVYVQLNDDYEGCHVTFPRQNFCVDKVPVGHAIIWPGLLTHSHYVTELKSGVKYTFTSFVWPPHWNDSTGFVYPNPI